MKIIGLIGGMSWESTAIYYQLINKEVKRRLGGLRSASLLLWSFDFEKIARLQEKADWQAATVKMVDAACRLRQAGAEAIVICTNTMHKMSAAIEEKSQLPVLHIVDAAAVAIQQKRLTKVALLATQFTMEQDFYKGRLKEMYQIDTIVPDLEDRKMIHHTIYQELCQSIIKEDSKNHYLKIIHQLMDKGAQGIILGCTEVGLLIKQQDVMVPVFDTTELHALSAVDFMLAK